MCGRPHASWPRYRNRYLGKFVGFHDDTQKLKNTRNTRKDYQTGQEGAAVFLRARLECTKNARDCFSAETFRVNRCVQATSVSADFL